MATVRQFCQGNGPSFGAPVLVGSVLVAFCFERAGPGGQVSLLDAGPATPDPTWTNLDVNLSGGGNGGVSSQRKVAVTSFQGPFYNSAAAAGHGNSTQVYEVDGGTIVGLQHLGLANQVGENPNVGTFVGIPPSGVVLMGCAIGQTPDPVIGFPNFSQQDLDGFIPTFNVPWCWCGRRTTPPASLAAAITTTSIGGNQWAAAAVMVPGLDRAAVLGGEPGGSVW